jgi:hypothetical protein
MSVNIVVQCPHCSDFIFIDQLNCQIFRHGVFISNREQINPHASKEVCDSLIQRKLIHGCGKPFKLVKTNDGIFLAEKCNYI